MRVRALRAATLFLLFVPMAAACQTDSGLRYEAGNEAPAPLTTTQAPGSVPGTDSGALASALTEEFEGDPNFASASVSREGSVTVYWYGDAPARAERLLGSYPDISVSFVETDHRPGDLRNAADQIFADNNDGEIKAVWVEPDGSAVGVMVDVPTQDEATAIQRRLADEYGVPVTAEIGALTPATGP